MGKYTHTLEDCFDSKIQNIIEKEFYEPEIKCDDKKLEGFNDREFIEVLSKLLCKVGDDKIHYSLSDKGYCLSCVIMNIIITSSWFNTRSGY